MKNKKGLVLSILLFLFIFGVTMPLFMTNNIKAKANTITNLTNTTWIINDNPSTFPSGYDFTNIGDSTEDGPYYINFISNEISFTSMLFRAWELSRTSMTYTNTTDTQVLTYRYNNGYQWANDNYKTIVITGGTDVTNSTLINWLQNNATQQIIGTQITKKYWATDSIIMQDDERIGDDDIQYKVLYNEFTDTYTNTTQTGLIFVGVQTEQTPSWSYIESINGDGINLLYHGTNNTLANTMLLEFTIDDIMDTTLYNLMSANGHWFDDYDAYLYGRSRGYDTGLIEGRALGQADGTQYTGLVTGIFNGLGDLLSVQVFPNITIGLLIGLPLLLGAFIIIIKILRG